MYVIIVSVEKNQKAFNVTLSAHFLIDNLATKLFYFSDI